MVSILKSLGILSAVIVCNWLWRKYKDTLSVYIDKGATSLVDFVTT